MKKQTVIFGIAPLALVYQPAPVIYVPAQASPAYIPRTAYERGMVDEQLRIERELERYEYLRGRQDARRYYYEE